MLRPFTQAWPLPIFCMSNATKSVLEGVLKLVLYHVICLLIDLYLIHSFRCKITSFLHLIQSYNTIILMKNQLWHFYFQLDNETPSIYVDTLSHMHRNSSVQLWQVKRVLVLVPDFNRMDFSNTKLWTLLALWPNVPSIYESMKYPLYSLKSHILKRRRCICVQNLSCMVSSRWNQP